MKRLTIIILSIFCFESCIENRIEDGWAKVRKNCSIEEYQEYLLENPNSVHLKEIIDSLRIFWEERNYKIISEGGHIDCFGNCLTLRIMKNNQIEFGNQITEKEQLEEKIKYSILNPVNLPNLSEKELITILEIGNVLKSKGFIDIISEDGFDNVTYSEIIGIAKKSFWEIRNENAIAIYNKGYEKLEKQEKEIIEQIVPLNIRFERMIFKEFEEPLPPKFDN